MGKGKSVFNTRTSHITKINTPDTVTKTSNFQGERVSNVTSHKIIRPASAIQESTIVSSGSNNFGEIPLAYGETEVEKTVDPYSFNFDSIGKKNSVFSDSGRIEEYTQDDRDERQERDDLFAEAEELRQSQINVYGEGIRDSSQFDGNKFEALTDQTPPSGVVPDKVAGVTLKDNTLATGNFSQFGTTPYYPDPMSAAISESKLNNPDAFKDAGAWANVTPNTSTMNISGKGPGNASTHGAIQTQLNKQKMDKHYNQFSDIWSANFTLQFGKENQPTADQAKEFIKSEKQKISEWDNIGGYNPGVGYQDMYIAEMDSKLNNYLGLVGPELSSEDTNIPEITKAEQKKIDMLSQVNVDPTYTAFDYAGLTDPNKKNNKKSGHPNTAKEFDYFA